MNKTILLAAFSLFPLTVACAPEAGSETSDSGSSENSIAISQHVVADGEDVLVTTAMHLSILPGLEASLGDDFDEGQLNVLQNVAHQRVVEMVCDGFDVDPARFESEMNLIYYGTDGEERDVTPEELTRIEQLATYGFGVSVGNQRAIAAYDPVTFCAHAEEERAAGGEHLIWASID